MNMFLIWMNTVMVTLSFTSQNMKTMEMKLFTLTKDMNMNFNMGQMWSWKMKMFIFMVMMVTMIVAMYSEIYMENYNNKKFFGLLLTFFLSMTVMSSSETMINLMMGWEMLGLSSLCLIMFYPNKTSKINSIMTMVFNRMGDVLMIMILGFVLTNYLMNYTNFNLTKEMCFTFMVASMTKSAQFPMSAWLPAAMAAPTPISAMVHSSTLVTAGIFLMVKIHESMQKENIAEILMYLSMTSFILGGWMSTVEMDFKKMIAYSTMSQISMIMLFSLGNLLNCSLTHMIFHAMFKTLLFCSAGFMFMSSWSEQLKSKTQMKKVSSKLTLMMFISVYCMTGLIFSSSFFTKDKMLEMIMWSSKNFLLFGFSMFASMLTMFYCVKMMKPLKKQEKLKTFFMKNKSSKLMMIFILMTMNSEWMSKLLMLSENNPQITTKEIMMMMLILMMIPTLMKKEIKTKKLVKVATMEVNHMKFQMYSYWSSILKSKLFNTTTQSDLIFMKKIFFLKKSKMKLKSVFPMLMFMTTMSLNFI